MDRDDILTQIQGFEPASGNWLPLDDLLAQLWQAGVTPECLPVLFQLFERYPDDDGAGVLWGIVHGLEASNLEYGEPLRASMEREPSLMGRIMLDRLVRANAA